MYRTRQEMREMIWSLEDALKKKHEQLARMKKREKERLEKEKKRLEKEKKRREEKKALQKRRELNDPDHPKRQLALCHRKLDAIELTSKSFLELAKQKAAESREDSETITEIIEETSELLETYKKTKPNIKDRLDEILTWLYKKIGGGPHQFTWNEGYVGFEDMLYRYIDLNNDIVPAAAARMKMAKGVGVLAKDRRTLRQMNEKVDECRLRCRLLQLSRVIESRGVNEDPLCFVFFLPTALVGLTYGRNTSYHYATELLRLCKRLLAFSEAIQHERDAHHEPIVTQSGILALPNPKDTVPSLYVPVQYADGNGETAAPCEIVVPIARDSSQCLNVSNGESIAPTDTNLPLAAKDSAVTLVSASSPKPLLANGEVMACEEKNKLVAKNSIAEMSPK